MKTLWTMFLFSLLIPPICSQHKSNWTLIESEIRLKFKQHRQFVVSPFGAKELLCNCTEPGCDGEITEIAGDEYSGICRAHNGGVCRKLVHYGKDGEFVKTSLSCVHPHQLLPPNRPFICESVTTPKFNQIVKCCSTQSFCNVLDYSDLDNTSKESLWVHYLIVLFLIIIFSAFVLFTGMWYCKESTPFAQVLTGSKQYHKHGVNGTRLDRLLDDLEITTSTGAGMPILAQRTISRQIRIKECIGKGRFGEVYVGEWREEKVAVKIFLSRDECSWSRETEIYRTNMLRHANLLRWIASDNKDTGTITQLWLVTEYLPNGSLYEYLERNTFSITFAVQFSRSIAHGLSYLHTSLQGCAAGQPQFKPGIAHCDLKSKNILLKNDMTCAIADLGMAVRSIKGVLDLPKHRNSRGGTVRYLAPEFLADTFVNGSFNAYLQMDIYAFALVMWEICRRIESKEEGVQGSEYHVPYFEYVQREPSVSQMHECVVVEKRRPSFPPSWNNSTVISELARIISESWSTNQNSRLTSLNIRYSLDKLALESDLCIVT